MSSEVLLEVFGNLERDIDSRGLWEGGQRGIHVLDAATKLTELHLLVMIAYEDITLFLKWLLKDPPSLETLKIRFAMFRDTESVWEMDWRGKRVTTAQKYCWAVAESFLALMRLRLSGSDRLGWEEVAGLGEMMHGCVSGLINLQELVLKGIRRWDAQVFLREGDMEQMEQFEGKMWGEGGIGVERGCGRAVIWRAGVSANVGRGERYARHATAFSILEQTTTVLLGEVIELLMQPTTPIVCSTCLTFSILLDEPQLYSGSRKIQAFRIMTQARFEQGAYPQTVALVGRCNGAVVTVDEQVVATGNLCFDGRIQTFRGLSAQP
ncbi:hypothetical protein B0H11DRAFT_1941098 [Mycena galericulata]|nr:hypothetical protein B0H11DRAFT_1941098 [Mycena galericulata]